MFTKKEKHIMKKLFKVKDNYPDQIAKPLIEEPRFTYRDPEDPIDGLYEYGFLGYGLTDQEIKERVEDMRLYVNSPYDCSGQCFTKWIDVHVNPSGLVSYVHTIGYDL